MFQRSKEEVTRRNLFVKGKNLEFLGPNEAGSSHLYCPSLYSTWICAAEATCSEVRKYHSLLCKVKSISRIKTIPPCDLEHCVPVARGKAVHCTQMCSRRSLSVGNPPLPLWIIWKIPGTCVFQSHTSTMTPHVKQHLSSTYVL